MIYKLGIDVSKWQTAVNWNKVREGFAFAFIRALAGVWEDLGFRSHWSMSKIAGVPRGAYLYYLDKYDGKAQARALHDLLMEAGGLGDLPPVLDVEEINNPVLRASNIRACLAELERLFGRVPIVYTRASVWTPKIGVTTWAAHYPLWVAHYRIDPWRDDLIERSAALLPSIPAGWDEFRIWQVTDKYPAAALDVVGTQTVDVNLGVDIAGLIAGGGNPPPSEGQLGTALVLLHHLTLRSRPRTDEANKVGSLNEGEIVKVLGVQVVDPGVEEWVIVERSDHRVGWAAAVHPTLTGAALDVYA